MYFYILWVNFSYINCDFFWIMQILRNLLLFLPPVSEYFCVMGQSAVAGVGFVLSTAFLLAHSMQRWNCSKNRAFFGTLWGTFMPANLYCSSSLCLQNWLSLSLQVPEKAAELLTGPLQFLGHEGFRLWVHWLGLSHHNFPFCCF